MDDIDQSLLREIRSELVDPARRVIAFVGSGLSRLPPSNLPSWAELCDQVLQDIDRQYGSTSAKTQAALSYRQAYEAAQHDVDFLILTFKKFSDLLGEDNFKACLQRLLRTDNLKAPEALRRLLAISFTGIVTTNLDQLIERTATEIQHPFEQIAKGPTAHAQPLARESNWLWKVHGCVTDPTSWVFTADSYFAARSTEHSYERNLKTLANSSRFVFFGFGGADPNIKWIMENVLSESGPRPDQHVVIARARGDIDEQFLRSSIRAIYYGGDTFGEGLLPVLAAISADRTREVTHEWRSPHLDSSLATNLRKLLPVFKAPPFVRELLGHRIEHRILPTYHDMSVVERTARVGTLAIPPTRVQVGEISSLDGLIVCGDAFSGRSTLLRQIAESWLVSRSGRPVVYVEGAKLRSVLRRNVTTLSEIVGHSLEMNTLFDRDTIKTLSLPGRADILIDDLDVLCGSESIDTFVRSELEPLCGSGSGRCAITLADMAPYSGPLPVLRCCGLSDEGIVSFVTDWTSKILRVSGRTELDQSAERILESVFQDSDLYQLAKYPVLLGDIIAHSLGNNALDLSGSELSNQIMDRVIYRASNASGFDPISASAALQVLSWELVTATGQSDPGISVAHAAELITRCVPEAASMTGSAAGEILSQINVFRTSDVGNIISSNEAITTLFAAAYSASRLAPNDDREIIWSRISRSNVPELFDRLPGVVASNVALTQHVITWLREGLARGHASDSVERWLLYFRLINRLHAGSSAKERLGMLGRLGGRARKDLAQSGKGMRERQRAALASAELAELSGENTECSWIAPLNHKRIMPIRFGKFEQHCWYAGKIASPVVEYELMRHPVTVDQFAKFVDSGGYRSKKWWSRDGWLWLQSSGAQGPGLWERQRKCHGVPVVNVNWHEAEAFGLWLAAASDTSDIYTLPTEEEWHHAATEHFKSELSSLFPWGADAPSAGEEAEINWAGTSILSPTAIGLFPKSTTESGITDLFGNVEEWCSSTWKIADSSTVKSHWVDDPSVSYKVVKGGSAIRAGIMCSPIFRSRCVASARYPTIGFRLRRSLT